MKITLCGSMIFSDEMLEIKSRLEKMAHEVDMPPMEILDENNKKISVKEYYHVRKRETLNNSWVWDRKSEAIKLHFKKIDWSDSVLILNYLKNGIEGYIGANTLLEIGLAFYLEKGIYLIKQIPEISYKEEILAMKPVVIYDDLKLIKENTYKY